MAGAAIGDEAPYLHAMRSDQASFYPRKDDGMLGCTPHLIYYPRRDPRWRTLEGRCIMIARIITKHMDYSSGAGPVDSLHPLRSR